MTATILDELWVWLRDLLACGANPSATEALVDAGFSLDALRAGQVPLGLYPGPGSGFFPATAAVRDYLERRGFTAPDIAASGVVRKDLQDRIVTIRDGALGSWEHSDALPALAMPSERPPAGDPVEEAVCSRAEAAEARAAAARPAVPIEILELPQVARILNETRGLVVVRGPEGVGKSALLYQLCAALVMSGRETCAVVATAWTRESRVHSRLEAAGLAATAQKRVAILTDTVATLVSDQAIGDLVSRLEELALQSRCRRRVLMLDPVSAWPDPERTLRNAAAGGIDHVFASVEAGSVPRLSALADVQVSLREWPLEEVARFYRVQPRSPELDQRLRMLDEESRRFVRAEIRVVSSRRDRELDWTFDASVGRFVEGVMPYRHAR